MLRVRLGGRSGERATAGATELAATVASEVKLNNSHTTFRVVRIFAAPYVCVVYLLEWQLCSGLTSFSPYCFTSWYGPRLLMVVSLYTLLVQPCSFTKIHENCNEVASEENISDM